MPDGNVRHFSEGRESHLADGGKQNGKEARDEPALPGDRECASFAGT
jgi:hypothetical protein